MTNVNSMPSDAISKYGFFLKGSAKGVLLIHGITGTPSEMRYLGKKLNKAGFTVLCDTLPGHCSSLGDLKKVTWQEISQTCVQSLKFLKQHCDEVFVGGLSMGALMAVHLAYQCPGDVKGIVALAPTFSYDGWAIHKAEIFLNLVWPIPFLRNRINIREGWPYGLKDEDLRWNIERFYKNAKSSEFSNKVLLFGSPFFPLACLYQHRLLAARLRQEMSAVKHPILIIHAKEDDMASPKNAKLMYDAIGSADKSLVMLEDSYHIIVIDKQKDLVANEVIHFLNRI
jgi:carboxylesterase